MPWLCIAGSSPGSPSIELPRLGRHCRESGMEELTEEVLDSPHLESFT